MRRRRLLAALGAGSLSAVAGCQGGDTGGDSTDGSGDAAATWPTGPYASYETTTVTVTSTDGEPRGTVTAAVARSDARREVGLTAVTSMPSTGGMLFVYKTAGTHQYDTQDMAFGLDLVYADSDRTITAIRDAPAPADDEATTYAGEGKYMLAVTAAWTAKNGVAVGDTLEFSL
jgi:uncharacterized membrane protein (UPF0127 family)